MTGVQTCALPILQRGFVAQDVEKIFPRWVSQDHEGYKNLNVSGIDPLSIESLRALHQQLTNITTQYAKTIQENNERLQDQKKTIEMLKQKLQNAHEKNK